MDKTLLIGFGNRMRQGKDVVAAHLSSLYGTKADVAVYGFGNLVRSEVPNPLGDRINSVLKNYINTNIELDKYSGYDLADIIFDAVDYRKILQFWGGKCRRSQDLRYWINRLNTKIYTVDKPEIALLVGVRFPNELGWVRSKSGIFVRVVRAGYSPDPSVANDITETALDNEKADMTLTAQDGDLNGLKHTSEEVLGDRIKTHILNLRR